MSGPVTGIFRSLSRDTAVLLSLVPSKRREEKAGMRLRPEENMRVVRKKARVEL